MKDIKLLTTEEFIFINKLLKLQNIFKKNKSDKFVDLIDEIFESIKIDDIKTCESLLKNILWLTNHEAYSHSNHYSFYYPILISKYERDDLWDSFNNYVLREKKSYMP